MLQTTCSKGYREVYQLKCILGIQQHPRQCRGAKTITAAVARVGCTLSQLRGNNRSKTLNDPRRLDGIDQPKDAAATKYFLILVVIRHVIHYRTINSEF